MEHDSSSESVSLQPCTFYCPPPCLLCEHLAQYTLFEMNEILGKSNVFKAYVSRTDFYRKKSHHISQWTLPAGLVPESTH